MNARSTAFGVTATALVLAMACATGDSARAIAATNDAPVRLSVRVDPRETTIGTPFRYTMRIEADAGLRFGVPILSDALGQFVITDFGEGTADDPNAASRNESASTIVERWYDMVGYETGDLLVPGIALQYIGADGESVTDYFPDAPVTLTSSFVMGADGSPAELRLPDIKGPVPVSAPRNFPLAVLLIVGAALCIVAMAYFALTRRSNPVVAARPAHEIALERLAKLEAAPHDDAAGMKPFYIELTTIVREYIEARFDVRAPEMTTEEFLSAAGRDSQLAGTDRSVLQGFLTVADLVKFARHVPGSDDAERSLNAAFSFVRATAIVEEESRRAAA